MYLQRQANDWEKNQGFDMACQKFLPIQADISVCPFPSNVSGMASPVLLGNQTSIDRGYPASGRGSAGQWLF